MILEKLIVPLTMDDSDYQSKIKSATTLSGGFVNSLSKIGGATVMGGIAVAGAGLAGLGYVLKEGLAGASEFEDAQAQLNAVLESTGGVAGVSADEVIALADNFEKLTKFSTESTMAGQNLLLTFTGIGKDIFPQVTEVMLDMSTAMGQDVKSSAIQLGKALNDPKQGLTALTRVGVVFTEEQKNMVQQLQDSGDIVGAQTIILQELQKEFGGSAVAAGSTFSGQIEIAKNALGALWDILGTALLPIITDFIAKLTEWASSEGVTTWITNAVAGLTQFLEAGINSIPVVLDWFKQAVAWLQENEGVVVAILAVLGASVLAFVFTTVIPAIVALIASALPIIAVLALIGGAVYLLYEAWKNNWGGIREKTASALDWFKSTLVPVFQNIWNGVVAVFNWFKNQFTTIFNAWKSLFQGDFYAFGQYLRQAWDNVWNLISNVAKKAFTWVKDGLTNLVTDIKDKFKNTNWKEVGKNIIQGIADGISSAAGFIVDAARQAAKAALDAAKGFLGIKSPSKVFAGVGKFMMLGMAEGISSPYSLNKVNSAIEGVTSNIVPDVSVQSRVYSTPQSTQSQTSSAIDYDRLAVLLRDAVLQVG